MKNLIGNTPMVKIKYRYQNKENSIYVKLEYYNYTGSIKDRIAYYILMKAQENGSLKARVLQYRGLRKYNFPRFYLSFLMSSFSVLYLV